MVRNNAPKHWVDDRLPAWDRNAALTATAGDEKLASELLEALLVSLPADLSSLIELLEAGDWPGIDDAAHRIRGATAYCGASALDKALQALKVAAKASDEQGVARSLQQVEHETERLRTEIR